MATPELHPARFWDTASGGAVRCHLCPHQCEVPDGGSGQCGARANRGGRLWSRVYGNVVALHVDPVEKKPLYHFLPGTAILSAGTTGCNLRCLFCQNWNLSRADSGTPPDVHVVSPKHLVEAAAASNCPSIAFTYNEPTIQAEYVMDVSEAAHAAGLRTVMVTNGYITRRAIDEVYRHIDAANVDLKAFDDAFYRRECDGSLAPVLATLEALVAMGVWVEVTTLVIPGLNDSPEAMRTEAAWIRDHLGADVPLHLSAFHPDYRMLDRPPTSATTIHACRDAARAEGLRYVYEGNLETDARDTHCPACDAAVVRRTWGSVRDMALTDGRCRQCGAPIAGVWS
jgi:pyruvate formate lyase activating enzyme